jgi:hypothetical protein
MAVVPVVMVMMSWPYEGSARGTWENFGFTDVDVTEDFVISPMAAGKIELLDE